MQLKGFIIPKYYRNLHEFLEILTKKSFENIPLSEMYVERKYLTEKLGISNEYLESIALILVNKNQIEGLIKKFTNEPAYIALKDGKDAFAFKRYLSEGYAIAIGRLKDILGITVSLIAIATAILSIASISNSNKRIERLKSRVDTIEQRILPTIHTAEHPEK